MVSEEDGTASEGFLIYDMGDLIDYAAVHLC